MLVVELDNKLFCTESLLYLVGMPLLESFDLSSIKQTLYTKKGFL